MTVYVDDWRQHARLGPVEASWSHLLADDPEELHRFARRLGLRRAWYQEHRRHPALNHYDVTEEARCRAIDLGAVRVTWREAGRMVRCWRRADPPVGSDAVLMAQPLDRRHNQPGDNEGHHGQPGDDVDRRAVVDAARDQGDHGRDGRDH